MLGRLARQLSPRLALEREAKRLGLAQKPGQALAVCLECQAARAHRHRELAPSIAEALLRHLLEHPLGATVHQLLHRAQRLPAVSNFVQATANMELQAPSPKIHSGTCRGNPMGDDVGSHAALMGQWSEREPGSSSKPSARQIVDFLAQ